MKLKKILAYLLSAVMIVSMAACTKGGPSEPSDKTDSTASVTDGTADALTLIENGKSSCKIIYPETCGDEVWASAKRLSATLKNFTGAELPYGGDLLAMGAEPDPDALEILVGKTNRPQSTEAGTQLKKDEFLVSVTGKKVVLCGFGDRETAKAVTYFLDHYVKTNPDLSEGKTDGTLKLDASLNYHKVNSQPIRSLTVGSVPIGQFTLVVPENGFAEHYIAMLIKRHIELYEGSAVSVITDASPRAEHELRIGVTNRTEERANAGSFLISVKNGSMEAVGTGTAALSEIYRKLFSLFDPLKQEIGIADGYSFTGDARTPDNVQNSHDFRILYHNVWGYLNYEKDNPVANRAELALAVYMEYQPEVLCFQEFGGNYRGSAGPLMLWLNRFYTEAKDEKEGSTGNPIFVRKDAFEILDQGYVRSRPGDKGTTWAVLKSKANGKLIAVTNSHFAADTNAGGDPKLGNEYRCQDAAAVLSAISKIQSVYGKEIDIVCGGDFNSNINSDPYRVLTDGNCKNIRDIAKTSYDFSAYNGSFTDRYLPDWELYLLNTVEKNPVEHAIDHVMMSESAKTVIAECYDAICDRVAATASDHLPHFVDFTWK